MEHSILGVRRTDRIGYTELRSKTRVADVGAKTGNSNGAKLVTSPIE